MVEILWYYAKDDRQLGPVTAAELRRLAAIGSLAPEDLIWREGMEGWAPAARLKALFPPGKEGAAKEPPATTQIPPAGLAPAGIAPAIVPPTSGAPVETALVELPVPAPKEANIDFMAAGPLPISGPEPPWNPGQETAPMDVASVIGPPREPRLQSVFADGPLPPPPAGVPPRAPAAAANSEAPAVEGNGVPLRKALLLIQAGLWGTCVLVVLLGGLIFAVSILRAKDSQEQAADGIIFSTFFIAAYVVARVGEKVSQLALEYFASRRK